MTIEDRGPQMMGVAILFLVLTWISIILRVYVRTFIIRALGSDDIVMLITQVFCTAYIACQLGGIVHGSGQHRSQLTDHNAQIALRYWFFCEVFYTLTTSILKISIGLFLLRITINPLHVLIIRFIMAASAVLGIAYCCVVIFQCKPISYWWDLDPTHHGKCLSASLVMYTCYVVSALNAFADWVFGVLPIFIVKDLQMKKSAKVIVATVLGFAALGSTATIVRFPYLWTLKQYKGEFLYRTADFAIWSTVEIGVGITAGCVATLKPLMRPFLAFIGIHTSTNPSSHMPWSTKRGKSGKSNFSTSQPLDELRPANDKSMTTTTVTGRGPPKINGITSFSGRESEEYIIPPGQISSIDYLDMKGLKGGISKSVEVTTTEERSSSKSGSGSTGGADTDEERGLPNPAKVYERF